MKSDRVGYLGGGRGSWRWALVLPLFWIHKNRGPILVTAGLFGVVGFGVSKFISKKRDSLNEG